MFLTIAAVSSARHQGRASRLDHGNTVAISAPRVDGRGSLLRKTAAIAMVGELMARIEDVAWKGAAELPVATVRRDV